MLALFNLHAYPVTLYIIEDKRLPAVFNRTVSFTYFSDLCLRLAVIGSSCYDVPACTRVNIFTFVGRMTYLVWRNYQSKNPWYANVLKAWFP